MSTPFPIQKLSNEAGTDNEYRKLISTNYKYTEAEEFSKHIEYGIDIGSGQAFRLDAYYGMCDLVAEALREHPTLLEKHWAICDESCYHDDSLHLLAFDIIYCARAYNLYQGITFIPKSQSTKAYTTE